MKQTGFYIDSSACIGCKTCELTCKDKNNLPMGVRLRKVREYGGGGWKMKDGMAVPENVFTYFVSASCMHCEKAACLENCPTAAISKDATTGAVSIDKEKCIGCRTCQDVCPYGAPSFDTRTDKMYKCDLCQDLLKDGKNPACVDACLQRCIKAGEINEFRKSYGTKDSVPPLPTGEKTKPSVVIKAAKAANAKTSGRIRNVTEL